MAHTDDVNLQLLEYELGKEIQSNKQAWRIIALLATCMVSTMRKVSSVAEELYGNGVPGGLKVEVNTLTKILVDGKPKDPFSKFIMWFADKVLPQVATAIVLAVLYLTFGGPIP